MKLTLFIIIAALLIGQAYLSPTPPDQSPKPETPPTNASLPVNYCNLPPSTTPSRTRRSVIFMVPGVQLEWEVANRQDNFSVETCWRELLAGNWEPCNTLPEMETLLDPNTLIQTSSLSPRAAKRREILFGRLQSHQPCWNNHRNPNRTVANLCRRFHQRMVSDCVLVSQAPTYCKLVNETVCYTPGYPTSDELQFRQYLFGIFAHIKDRLRDMHSLAWECYNVHAFTQAIQCNRITWNRRTHPWTRLEAKAIERFDYLVSIGKSRTTPSNPSDSGNVPDFELNLS